jgi:hypothetical protein
MNWLACTALIAEARKRLISICIELGGGSNVAEITSVKDWDKKNKYNSLPQTPYPTVLFSFPTLQSVQSGPWGAK